MLTWRRIANGMVLAGFLGDRQLVGITGPHPNGRFAVSSAFAPDGARWELFVRDLEKAKARAEVVCRLHPRAAGSRA